MYILVFENLYFQHQHISGVKNCVLSPLGPGSNQIEHFLLKHFIAAAPWLNAFSGVRMAVLFPWAHAKVHLLLQMRTQKIGFA